MNNFPPAFYEEFPYELVGSILNLEPIEIPREDPWGQKNVEMGAWRAVLCPP